MSKKQQSYDKITKTIESLNKVSATQALMVQRMITNYINMYYPHSIIKFFITLLIIEEPKRYKIYDDLIEKLDFKLKKLQHEKDIKEN